MSVVPGVVVVSAFQPSLFLPGEFEVSWSHSPGGVAVVAWLVVLSECSTGGGPLNVTVDAGQLSVLLPPAGPGVLHMRTCYRVSVAAVGAAGVGPSSTAVTAIQQSLRLMQPIVLNATAHNCSVSVTFNSSQVALPDVLQSLALAYVVAAPSAGSGTTMTETVVLSPTTFTYR